MTPDARLVPAAIGAWGAAAVLIGVPGIAGPAAGALGSAAFVAAVAAIRAGGRRAHAATVATLLLGTAAAVALAIAVRAPERQPAELTRAARAQGAAEVLLTGLPRPAPGVAERTLVEGELRSFRSARGELSVRVPVLLFVAGSPDQEALRGGVGSRISVRTALRPADPGEDVAYFASAGSVELLEDPPGWLSWADHLRDRFAAVARTLPGDGAALLPGLALGDDGGVPSALRDDLRESSLSHLTAVSGANCAVVVAAVLVLARAAGLSRALRTAVAGLALLAFVVLVTPQPSVLRAAVMGLLVLAADARGRRGGALPVLSSAVVVLLSADPWLSRDAAFALSVLATAGLVVLAAPVTVLLARVLPGPLAAAVAVPACAQLACQPVLVLLDPAVSLWSVPANLLAAPAAPLVTLLGLASCMLLPLLPALGHAVLWMAWAPAAWIAAIGRSVAESGAGRVAWPEGGAGASLLAAITVAIAAAVLAPRRRLLGLVATGALLSVIAVGVGGALGLGRSMPPGWRIASCDVGQGDASVLRAGDGQFAVIDTGPDAAPLTSCLDRLGVQRIALLVLTHFDADHVGAAHALAGRVDELLVGPSDGPDADRLTAALAASGASVTQAGAGDSGLLGEMSWRVLWPPAGTPVEPGNEASVVIEADVAGLRALFLGDLGEEAQSRLLRRSGLQAVDVVKVSHHGSADQSEKLYERLAAPVALISCGADNSYGHPAPRLLGILDAAGSTPFRTDRNGMLLVAPVTPAAPGRAGSPAVRVWAERPAEPSRTPPLG